MSESVCPLCKTPRPRGATRCRCNYTFEYDARGSGAQNVRGPASPAGPGGVVLGALVAGVVAYWLGTDLDRRVGTGNPAMWVLVAGGAFSIAGALGDWPWFMGHRRARLFVAVFGRSGARIVYGILGGVLIGLGGALALA